MTRETNSCKLRRGLSLAAILALSSGVPCAVAQVQRLPPTPAPLYQDWVAIYNGDSSYWEELHDLALGEDSVYVTGFSYGSELLSQYATVKYDYSGQQQWVRLYSFDGQDSGASAQAVALDEAGNVFVTGWSGAIIDSERYVDAATLKYDADGNLLWEHRYRLPGRNNQPHDIAIDSAGNVYVAGAAWVGPGFDLLLIKYSPDGALLWDRTIGRSGDRWDGGYALAIDANDNPVVAGYTQPYLFNTLTFGYLVKYSSGGDLLWQRPHKSYTNASAWWRVAINEAGRIYAFGEIAPPGDLYHLWTSQYDANGTLIWDRHYDGTASGANYRGGMALTPTGGVVVCGISDDFVGYGVTNIVTIRYEADGREVWRRLARGGYDQAGGRDVAVDAAGNAYVTGFGFNDNENMDFVTLKYGPDGRRAWTMTFAGDVGATDWPIRIAVDDTQNVFVAGDTQGGLASYFDFATIRYRQIPRGPGR